MLGSYVFFTVNQKVLGFLAKFSDGEFYEREIARRLGIAYGSANRALNGLYSAGVIKRIQKGRMYFYSIDTSNPMIVEYKKLVSLGLVEPLVEKLKDITSRIVLYGSCARGDDTSRSDFDLFIVTNNKDAVLNIIADSSLPKGYENLRIQPVVKTPVELLMAGDAEKAFLDEVERGITLWERVASESRLQTVP